MSCAETLRPRSGIQQRRIGHWPCEAPPSLLHKDAATGKSAALFGPGTLLDVSR